MARLGLGTKPLKTALRPLDKNGLAVFQKVLGVQGGYGTHGINKQLVSPDKTVGGRCDVGCNPYTDGTWDNTSCLDAYIG